MEVGVPRGRIRGVRQSGRLEADDSGCIFVPRSRWPFGSTYAHRPSAIGPFDAPPSLISSWWPINLQSDAQLLADWYNKTYDSSLTARHIIHKTLQVIASVSVRESWYTSTSSRLRSDLFSTGISSGTSESGRSATTNETFDTSRSVGQSGVQIDPGQSSAQDIGADTDGGCDFDGDAEYLTNLIDGADENTEPEFGRNQHRSANGLHFDLSPGNGWPDLHTPRHEGPSNDPTTIRGVSKGSEEEDVTPTRHRSQPSFAHKRQSSSQIVVPPAPLREGSRPLRRPSSSPPPMSTFEQTLRAITRDPTDSPANPFSRGARSISAEIGDEEADFRVLPKNLACGRCNTHRKACQFPRKRRTLYRACIPCSNDKKGCELKQSNAHDILERADLQAESASNAGSVPDAEGSASDSQHSSKSRTVNVMNIPNQSQPGKDDNHEARRPSNPASELLATGDDVVKRGVRSRKVIANQPGSKKKR